MKEYIASADLKNIFTSIYEVMLENKDRLTELDAAIGDGDLGLTMCDGFNKICESLKSIAAGSVGETLSHAGMVMNKNVPSTMGTILSVSMIKMGMYAKNKEHLLKEEIPEMFEAGLKGMMAIGKSQVGDKTVLDALFPAYEAMKTLQEKGGSLADMLEAAVKAAEEGVENTKNMISKHGRGSWYQEKSIGKQDPGATAGMLIITGIHKWYQNSQLEEVS